MTKRVPLLLEIAGGVALVAGVGLLSVAAALIVAGVLLLAFGVATEGEG